MNKVFIAIGSNIGKPIDNIKKSLVLLEESGFKITDKSRLYVTPPMYVEDQPDFYNMVICGTSSMQADDLLVALKDIEERVGRTPNFRNGPRLIDLDILYYNELLLDSDNLCIPHIAIFERPFVLLPLIDINKNHYDTRTKKRVIDMYDDLEDELSIKSLGYDY